jgi:bifunctional DNase/RNase
VGVDQHQPPAAPAPHVGGNFSGGFEFKTSPEAPKSNVKMGAVSEAVREATTTESLIEVAVDSIRVHMPTGQHVVILKEKDADRYLPIWIGVFEANAIALKITGISTERPITHDLMAKTMEQLRIGLSRIVVTSLNNEVFYARLFMRQDGQEIDIDARPSDAIALAVRLECPIFVSSEVLDRAGVIPEKEDGEAERIDDDKLAVFRDLVNSLDLPELPDEPGRG